MGNSKMKQRWMFGALLVLSIAFVGLSAIAAVSIGQVSIPVSDAYRVLIYQLTGFEIGDVTALVSGPTGDIVWQIRFPRVLMALIVGAGLAMCGTVMQAAVQNPLADPYILGISSGAALGATFSIMLGFGTTAVIGELGVAFWAFSGALCAAAIVLLLASMNGKMSSVKLVLAGMVVNALCSAFSNFIISIANNAEGIRTITFWTMGSLASANWAKLPLVAVIVIVAAIFLLFQSRILNTMLLGDEAAVTLGINLAFYRKLYLTITSIVTGVIVATCGIIGFVGLIIPHIVRSVVGTDHNRLMPMSLLASSAFLIWTDVLARMVMKTSELPIGIITSFIGAPLFMYLLVRKNYGFGGK